MRKKWAIGDQIRGRWEISKILEGGAGVVYVVYDHAFHEVFAAKTFKDEVFAQSPLIADRFQQEAFAWIKLDVHPNVTQARMVETIEGKPFLFLEYVSGGDMGSWIDTPRLTQDLRQVLDFAIAFCDGMIHATSKGIRAHRDIKPQNCLISSDGVLKVTDFGLAKLLSEERLDKAYPFSASAPELTVAAVGTCTHMAPEQFRENGPVDARVDVYAFGVMLYQMIRGKLPFQGETWQDLEDLHTKAPPPYLTETNRDLADLVQTCLAKEPSRRYSDFGQLREDLATIYTNVTGAPCMEPVQGKALTAVQWNNKGTSLSNLGKQAESIHCYEKALELDPTLSSAWFNKGVALFETKQVSEALACYERALRLNPKSEQIWSNKGVALKSLGKVEDAAACYNRALQLNPRYANSWINKGVLLRTLGKIEEALACYDRALRLDPNNANAWTNKGNILFSVGRIAESLDCYDHALSLNTALALTWLNKGIALDALAKHEDALHCYSSALELNPRLEQAWFRRGMTMVNAFQLYREAVPYFEQADRLGVKEAKPALALCQGAAARR